MTARGMSSAGNGGVRPPAPSRGSTFHQYPRTTADWAVPRVSCGRTKTGALSRSDRTAEVNKLLRIDEEPGALRGREARGLRR
ncbi:hypothetical protein [Streptomyces sp. NPDC059224]|uniref:hypothetical protein n=1 Tax=Streptomyces sp. NPDC059224 TaxID=3346775 RepID=UPI003695EA9B